MANIVGAGAFGAMLGVLVGLSTQPVIVSVITALLGLVGGVLGVGLNKRTSVPQLDGAALAAFSLLFAGLGLVGVHVRANDMLVIAPEDYAQRWQNVPGITKDQAARLTVLKVLGSAGAKLAFPDLAEKITEPVPPVVSGVSGTGFFAKSTTDCKRLSAGYESVELLVDDLRSAKSEPAFAFIADVVTWLKATKDLSDAQRLEIGKILVDRACERVATTKPQAEKP